MAQETAQSQQDLFTVSGKVAVVTGGSRGIGLMIARGLLQGGAKRVYISSRKADACEAARQELSQYGDVVAIPADLSTEAETKRLADEVGSQENELHILVNNAGATWGTPLAEFTEDAWDKVMNTNVRGPFFLTKHCLPLLEKAATDEDPGRIVNIGSIDGLHVNPLPHFPYSASKAGIHHLTRVLARELASKRITVNAVAPGPFPSKMMAFALEDPGTRGVIESNNPLGRIGRPDDMAGVTLFLCSRAGSYVNGAVIPVDGGISAVI